MYPSLAGIRNDCAVSTEEEMLLLSTSAPIVLITKLKQSHPPIAESVAPHNPNLGVMLPYSPLHHLLMGELNFPVVATSANLGDEPICIDEKEALDRLKGIADVFLVHNRPIVRHVDDSVARMMYGENKSSEEQEDMRRCPYG
jgi:hydrogenase maturation protein HypF